MNLILAFFVVSRFVRKLRKFKKIGARNLIVHLTFEGVLNVYRRSEIISLQSSCWARQGAKEAKAKCHLKNCRRSDVS